jgi:hypothetical protein
MNVDSQLYLNIVRMPASYPASIVRDKDQEDEDLEGDRQYWQTSGPRIRT